MGGNIISVQSIPAEPPREKRDLRLFLAAFVLAGLAFVFWTGSRYPSLNEKAMMGGDTPMSGLAFDILFHIMPDSPTWWEFVANTVNWIATNQKGMTFGVLFGAAILTLLSLIKKRSFQNGFANAALGTAIGAPLGVCVNCAAPIALGLHQGRMRLETTLSALLASPTLNVIVVTMSFAMLPFHMAAIKLLLALVMVLLIVPLLCRFFLSEEAAASGDNLGDFATVSEAKGLTAWIGRALAPQDAGTIPDSPGDAVIWYVKTFLRNLGFVALITVPMMLVAAMLGALVAIGFDSQELVYALPRGGAFAILAAMLLAAIVASFVPAPIALDVILTTVLVSLGLSSDYATAILIGLGSFSIYAFIIVWRSISMRTAIVMWIAVIGMAMTGGVLANRLATYETAYIERHYVNYLIKAEPVSPPALPPLPEAKSADQLRSILAGQAVEWEPLKARIASDRNSRIEVFAVADQRQSLPTGGNADRKAAFSRVPGQTIGFDERGMLTPAREFGVDFMPGGIAAGDINNDGWIDVVVPRPTGGTGLSLYVNVGGRFERQATNLGKLRGLEIHNVALVDIDNDALLDIVASTRRDGLFVLYNRAGQFDIGRSRQLADIAPAIAIAMGFADLNADGRVDIVSGNWTGGGMNESFISVVPQITANTVFWNRQDGSFEPETLPGLPGQTLTVLLSDFDGDRQIDVFKGDDAMRTDQVVFFNSLGRPQPVVAERQPFPYSMQSTMSMDDGDWNNDLIPDYYGGQITDHEMQRLSASTGEGRVFEICMQFVRDGAWDRDRTHECAAELKSIDSIRDEGGGSLRFRCENGIRPQDTTFCMVRRYLGHLEQQVFLQNELTQQQAFDQCRTTLVRMEFALEYCGMLNYDMWHKPRGAEREKLPVLRNLNMLMTGQPDGSYRDLANQIGAQTPGWTWNSRFTDLDQDGWQDLLVMTGMWAAPTMGGSNKFYHNRQGELVDGTDEFGFHDILPSYSFASFDYDRDGDIDVIRPPEGLNMIVHRNESPAGAALWINLRDERGNSMGIGSRVTICVDGQQRVEAGRCFMRTIKASGGFMSFEPIAAHFGLGDALDVSLIEVRWPDSETTVIRPTNLRSGELTVTRKR